MLVPFQYVHNDRTSLHDFLTEFFACCLYISFTVDSAVTYSSVWMNVNIHGDNSPWQCVVFEDDIPVKLPEKITLAWTNFIVFLRNVTYAAYNIRYR